MSELNLVVGQKADGHMSFDEIDPPADGAVKSDNEAVAPITLAADHVSWHCEAVSVGVARVSFMGTSAAPDVGPAVVPDMIVTVTAAPMAEHGEFDPKSAVITGP